MIRASLIRWHRLLSAITGELSVQITREQSGSRSGLRDTAARLRAIADEMEQAADGG